MSLPQVPVYDKSDPRAGEPPIVPFHVPRHWEETSDYFGTIATTLGGLAMVGKQPMAAWLAIAAAMLGVMNARPLTEKKDKTGQSTASSPWGALAMGVAGLLGTYVPRVMMPPQPPASKQ
ncbi:hypothetical protein HD553DRAFT_346851 [Filobasidium floriforme]|uniref:uncharacterized protein n=1 Tax=Filobasidium floriforme TaxID=5210 RepID=UPI001E8EF30C|nr:uncharacterized protein HD553DRAFT_346851 [Filobasidium floriforme]KAH8090343.1 hypothetical protein HD553DRAFT_346851 [Filobasidium floriforme]